MEAHEVLLDWATKQDVKLNGIAPKRIPGRGIGLIATRAIKPDEIVLEVPTACLRNINTVPRAVCRKLPGSISVQGLLAADLALDTTTKYDPWNAVCPTPQDLTTMPLVWPTGLHNLLPQAAGTLLSKQQAKFKRDWATVSPAFPDLVEEDYRYAWILVNTRTFYYLNSKLKKRRKEDHLCLQPVADLFNHGDEGCNVAFDNDGFAVTAHHAYAEGDEVKFCYGRHGGDFLLVEYGFVMDNNRWDEVVLDEVVLSRLSPRQKERLEEVGFLGQYAMDRETVCYRTQVALRLLCRGTKEWKSFVDGLDDGESSQGDVDRLLMGLLRQYKEKAEAMVKEVDGMALGAPEQRRVLLERWKQIGALVDVHISKLNGNHND